MKKNLVLVAFLIGLALVTHIGVKSVYSFPPPPPPPCFSVLDDHGIVFDGVDKVKLTANGRCNSGYQTFCQGISYRVSVFAAVNGEWEGIASYTGGVNNPTCGSNIVVSTVDFPLSYLIFWMQYPVDPRGKDLCYVWDGYWNNNLTSPIFHDEIVIPASSLQ